MYVCTSVRPLSPDELQFRRRALRDAVICIGWLKILSMICYIGLYVLVHAHSKGTFSIVIQVLIVIIIPIQIINGVLLFLGAVEIKILALNLALWMSFGIGVYNTILGLMGGIYFLRTGFQTIHFLLAIVFAILSLSIFTVLCHDVIVIYTFKTLVQSPTTNPVLDSIFTPLPSSISRASNTPNLNPNPTPAFM